MRDDSHENGDGSPDAPRDDPPTSAHVDDQADGACPFDRSRRFDATGEHWTAQDLRWTGRTHPEIPAERLKLIEENGGIIRSQRTTRLSPNLFGGNGAAAPESPNLFGGKPAPSRRASHTSDPANNRDTTRHNIHHLHGLHKQISCKDINT